MKILEIKGLRGVRVFQLYQQVLISFAMCPVSHATSFESFFDNYSEWTPEEKEKALRVGITLFDFSKEDINIILGFALNDNGVEVSNDAPAMSPIAISQAILEVFKAVDSCEIFLASKKK